ncbi:MAG: chromosome segregation protein SMC [Planctomycetes bacterium]|nr:chromosome segregation protein SMC [Planctomycetota bacterium]
MLKSLELFGFKSFADRTHFDFSTGITGIVGPNGSGKSNVVDGIKWILGDQSAKSLRGKEMTDVIFNGAAGRKESGFAEATLTFDNSSNFLPLESQEVQIGRRLYRNGDSEYLINRTPVRLKDIRNLFMGTGAGSASYSIIEQGQVDQILQANAISRRAIFEEAAGISRYKSRRTEALRKLEQVDQNLIRLTDIVDEVEAQLNSIRSQAAKAAQFREISNELKEQWLGLAADDSRHLSLKLGEIEEAIGRYHAQIEEQNSLHQQLESRISVLDVEIADVENRLREVERQGSANREAIASHQSTVAHQSNRLRELNAEIIRLRSQRALMETRSKEVTGELEHNRRVLEESQHEFAQVRKASESRDTQIRKHSERLEDDRKSVETKRNDILIRMREISEIGNRISGLQSQSKAAASAQQNAQKRLKKLNEQISHCRTECEKKQLLLDETSLAIAALEETIQNVQLQKLTLVGEQNRSQQTLAELREKRSAWLARKNVLEDLESRQEGLGIGVKDILNRAKTSDFPPWNQVLGSVADLLEVELEEAALLEVALGSRAQLIVMREFDSLKEYLNRGTSQIAGRVSFLCLSGKERIETSAGQKADSATETLHGPSAGVPGNQQAFSDLTGRRGVLKRADALVRPSEKCPQLAYQLLADTWVVETIDVAMSLFKKTGHACRFVTLQGEFLDADGILVVGTVRSETAIVSRKSELRRLNIELKQLANSIHEEELRLSSVGESLSDVDASVRTVDLQMQELIDRQRALKSELTSSANERERLLLEHETLNVEIRKLAVEENQVEEKLQQTQLELVQTEEERQAQQDEIDQAEREIARLEHRLQTLKQKKTAEQLDLAKQEERHHNLRSSFERLQRDQEQRIQQHEEVERRFSSALSKRRQISLHILNTNAVLAELSLTGEQFEEKVKLLLVRKDQLREQRGVLHKKESRIRQRRRELHELLHQQEIKQRDIRHQIGTLEERIEEEYHLSLSEVVKSGASAVRLYVERQAETNPRKTESKPQNQMSPEGESDGQEPVAIENDSDNASQDGREIERDGSSSRNSDNSHNSKERLSDLSNNLRGTSYEQIRDVLEANVNRLRRKLKMMGSVNSDSLKNLDDLESRYGHLSTQLQDLVEAKNVLEEIVHRINAESRRLFSEAFESIRVNFQELFRKMFSGGNGDVLLEDPEDVLECGIDIVARPPGKELKSISLMSGGEKSLTAFALLLSIFKCRPSPYCVLDEVDAALDEANVERFLSILEEFKQTTQFILITHKKPTMTIADLLYGITMEQSGISKRVSVRFEDIREDGKFTETSPDLSILPGNVDGHAKDAA